MPSAAQLGGCELSHSSPQAERRFSGHPPTSDGSCRHSCPRSAYSPEMEGLALSHLGAPSFALSAKGGNAFPLAQSRIRVKLLEVSLTCLKSATSLLLIDNFYRHSRSQSAHSPEMEALVSRVGIPSFALSAKGGNAFPLPQSKIRAKLLENLLTALKSARSLFLIDNFCALLQFAAFTPKENPAHD